MAINHTYDCAVIGSGVFGAWTAWHLSKRGQRVLILDAYGAAHSRSSSGGESRIIRMSYGAEEIYTRWSMDSLTHWKELFARTHQPLFRKTGVLWMAGQDRSRLTETIAILRQCGVAHEVLNKAQLERRYPQVNFAHVSQGVYESESGVLLARRAVACVVEEAVRTGAEFRIAQVLKPLGSGALSTVQTSNGASISANNVIFACGPWLGKIFPELLGNRIFPTRQEVFFFGCPPGDARFAPPALPSWMFEADQAYGMPDLEARGLKLARDKHGEPIDPDNQSRIVSTESVEWAREYVAKRLPDLRDAPIVETRVCQYENTSSGDFLVDRHPDFLNVWMVGGGSGHGFKHGPAIGQYVADQILGRAAAEPRFSLATKATEQRRAVY